MSKISGPVIHLCTATSWRGGEQQALYLATGLRDRGVDNVVICQPGSPMAERAREAGLKVAEVKCRAEFDPFAIFAISSVLRKEKAALVHAHDGHAVMLAALAGRLAGVPRLCTRRVDFDLKSSWKYSWGMDRVICISEAIKKICADAGVPENKMPVVMSGIDFERVTGVQVNRDAVINDLIGEQKKRPLILLNVASLTDHKGQRYLLEAMPEVLAKVPQTFLIIVGDGELRSELRRLANSLALDEHCLFTGFRDDVPELLHSADLFVMSSHLEGLCTSVMDAMAAGLAVVASRAGGLPELVEDGKTGILVEPKNPVELAAALVDLMGDRKKRERYAKASEESAKKRFGTAHMVEGTLAVYRQMPGGAPEDE